MKSFSETYYPFSKKESWKHVDNNKWFKSCLKNLKEKQLFKIDDIPLGPKYFNKQGEEVDSRGNSMNNTCCGLK